MIYESNEFWILGVEQHLWLFGIYRVEWVFITRLLHLNNYIKFLCTLYVLKPILYLSLLINLYSYTLDDLLKESSYLITLTIRSCFESSDPQCDSSESYTVFNRSILPKTDCVWKTDFKHTGKISIVSDLITLTYR